MSKEVDLWLDDRESRKFVDEMLKKSAKSYDCYLAAGDHILHWFTEVAREHVISARRDELLEIGLLAHKFEGKDFHCREIADAIDERVNVLPSPTNNTLTKE